MFHSDLSVAMLTNGNFGSENVDIAAYCALNYVDFEENRLLINFLNSSFIMLTSLSININEVERMQFF